MADQFWQPYWNNVDRRREDTRYQNALARQDMLDQRGVRADKESFVADQVQSIAALPEEQRPQAWQQGVASYERLFGETVQPQLRQYNPQVFQGLAGRFAPEQVRAEDNRQWMQNALAPQQQFSDVGPYAGGMQRPDELTRKPMGRNALVQGMFQRGMLDAPQYLNATAPQDPFANLQGDARNLATILGRFPTVEELEDYRERGATKVSQKQMVSPEGTKDIVEPILKTLPERSNEVRGDYQAYQRLKGALDVVNKQGDKITGLSGSIRRALAPIATAVGLNTEEMTDAELLGTMLDTSAGSMRMEVVGPGPVTEYEQGILQKVSGKKMSAAEGLRRILTHHMKNKKANINQFNKMIKAVADQPGYGVLDLIYQPIEIKEEDPRRVRRRGTLNGRTVIEYTNGDIEYAD